MELSKKLPLYEILAMIIPGGVIIASIWIALGGFDYTYRDIDSCCTCGQNTFFTDVIIGIIFITTSYIVGLIIHAFAEITFSRLRNNPKAIETQLENIQKNNKDINLRSFLSINRDLDVRSKYILAYCNLMEKNKLGAVPLIESQVAFLRNLIMALACCPIIYLIIIGLRNHCCCTCNHYVACLSCSHYIIATVGIWAGCFILYLVMKQRQNKIYHYIWESINYLKL